MNFLPAHRLRLYRNFKALEVNDFHGIIRFYEQFEDGIRALDFEEYFDCTQAYTNALFQTGNHGKHVVMCDHLLEIIIMQNVETWGGEDLYAKTLFLKAASLYRMHEYPKRNTCCANSSKYTRPTGCPAVFWKNVFCDKNPPGS